MRVSFLLAVVLLGLAGFSTVLAEAEASTPATDASATRPTAAATEPEEAPVVVTAEEESEEPEEEPAEPETPPVVASAEEEDEDAVLPEPEDALAAATTPVADIAPVPAIVDDDGTELSGVGDVTKEPTGDIPTAATVSVTDTVPPADDEADPPASAIGEAAFTAPPEPEDVDDSSDAASEDYVYVSTEGDEWIPDKYDYSDDTDGGSGTADGTDGGSGTADGTDGGFGTADGTDGGSGTADGTDGGSGTAESGESSVFADGDDNDDVTETTRALDGTVFVEPGNGAGTTGGDSWITATAITGVAATAALLL